jgi:hypothetical protein
MDFYQRCAEIIDANTGNESVDKIIQEIKKCQMMFNCSVFTKELRRYITETRSNNPYNDEITKLKLQKEPDIEVIDIEEHKAKVLRGLLPWEQKKLYMKAVIASLQLHQNLNNKDIHQLLKGMVYEDAAVFKHYETGHGKMLPESKKQ